MSAQAHKIELCMSGAGTYAPLHVGGVLALEDAGIVSTLNTGASAGAIVAGCMSLGMTGTEMEDVVLDADFRKLIPIRAWTYPFRGYAASNANATSWLKEITKEQSLADCSTPLIAVCGDELLKRPASFSSLYAGEGDLPVWKAVLPSFSIPEVFPAFEGRYCDGGVMMNLPVTYLHGKHPRLAFRVTERSKEGPIKGWLDRQERVLDMMLAASERDSVLLAKKEGIPVIDLPGGSLGFLNRNMTQAQKQGLVEIGYNAVSKYLASGAGKRWLAS